MKGLSFKISSPELPSCRRWVNCFHKRALLSRLKRTFVDLFESSEAAFSLLLFFQEILSCVA